MIFGVATAIILRIFFASIITPNSDMPYIRTIGGILFTMDCNKADIARKRECSAKAWRS